MLKQISLTGDAMAHAILPSAAIRYLVSGLSLGAMTICGQIAGMVVARVTALREEASLAAFYLITLTLSVLIVSTRGNSVDLVHVLFGTVLALDNDSLVLLFSFTYFSFLPLVVMNLVGGFLVLGTLMAVGIMILPVAAAYCWSALMLPTTTCADQSIPVVANFSFLGDMVDQIDGQHIALTTLVGPNGDAHVYQPAPLVAHGLMFEAPRRLRTESEAGAKDVTRLIEQMREHSISDVFVESSADSRLQKQIANKKSAGIGGTPCLGALSEAGGPGSTYLDLMRHNATPLSQALEY